MIRPFKATQIIPAAWWALGLALAIAAGTSGSLAWLVALMAITLAIIVIAREPAPWSQSLRFYLVAGLAVTLIRVVFRIIFNFDSSSDVALNLPVINLNFGALGEVELFGRVSYQSLTAAVKDGLKMAAVILAIGLANTLANPRRLLKNMPGALYEVATAFVIAINLAPQVIASAQRVRQARELRGRSKNQNLMSSLLIPVLEDTLERSLALAATMDARGFGRTGELSKNQQFLIRFTSLTSVAAFAVGSYLLMTMSSPFAPIALFACGLIGVFITVRTSSLRNIKTSYTQAKWHLTDVAVLALSGLLATAAIGGLFR
jgi:energy-coupling factor transport system permease protein